MVARITVSKSIHGPLQYNEQKVGQGVARCLYAHRFLKEAAVLSFGEKRDRFDRLIALNKRAVTNAVHISLNFGVEESLNPEILTRIAHSYMEKIGFGEQPYLVYQHHDAGHPHLHIVSTTIQSSGRRISLHNIGRRQSEAARKELEIIFGLQRAEAATRKGLAAADPLEVQRLVYGREATKKGLERVLQAVLPHYKYTSLQEMNAVLKCYNIRADRGAQESTLYRQRGLVFRVLDAQGKAVGVPLKASSLSGRPTLGYLEGLFVKNGTLRQPYLKSLKGRLDWMLTRPPASLEAFAQALAREKISLQFDTGAAGEGGDVIYVDHQTKCVFTGSAIGKAYSGEALLKRYAIAPDVAYAYTLEERTAAALTKGERAVEEQGPNRRLARQRKEGVPPPAAALSRPAEGCRKKQRKSNT